MGNSFGLDIGSVTMKAVFIQSEKGVYKFQSSIVAKTPAKGMLSDASLDQEEMAQNIRQMIVDARIPSRNVHLALSDNHVFSKVIDMPLLSDKELASAINWEAEQHIPVPLNTINLDYKVLRRDIGEEKARKMQVLLVGAPTSLLKKYEHVFELSGINIFSLETELLSVIRAIVTTPQFPNSLIVNIGSLGTSLAIVQKGVPVFLYTIPLGGVAMNRSIATELGFNMSQAEEYKKTYGMDEVNFGGKIKAAIEPILLSLITEIKKALSFYIDKYKEDHPIGQIVITGGTARLPGIVPVFVQQTGLETVIANPWKSLGIQNVPVDLMEAGPEYTIAVGLAVK
jgi:type IV pilus assembly protein PilM